MKRLVFLLLGAVLLAATVAAGCGSSAPGDAINKAIQNNSTIKTGHVDYNLVLDIQGDASALGPQYAALLPLHLTVDGGVDVDQSNQSNIKAQGDIKLGGLDKVISGLAQAGGASGMESQLGATIASSLASDIQFAMLDNVLYVKLAGSWYQMPVPTGSAAGAMTTTTPANSSCYENALKDSSKFGSGTIFKDLTDAGTESIDGVNTHHYTASINFDTLLTQMANTSRDCGNASAAGGLEAAKGEIGNVFKTASVDMWVGDDNYFHQVKLNLQLDPSTVSGLLGSLSSGSSGSSRQGENLLKALKTVTLTVTLKQSKINQSMNITKPQGPIQNLSDLAGSFGIGGTSGSSSGSSTTLPPNDGSGTGTDTGAGLNST